MEAPPSHPIYLSKDGAVFGPYTPVQIEALKQSGEYQTFSWIYEGQAWAPINPPNLPPAPPASSSSGKTNTGISFPGVAAAGSAAAPKRESATLPGISRPAVFDDKTNTALTRAQLGGASPSPTHAPAGARHAPSSSHGSHASHSPAPSVAPRARPAKLNVLAGVPAICHNNRSIVSGSLGEISKEGCIFRSQETPRSLPEFHRGGKVKLNILEESSGRSENLEAVIRKTTLHEGHWEFYLGWDRVPVILEHLNNG